MNIVEMFSGIGAQAKALEKLGYDYKVLCTCDWDINAIIAYDIIHNGPQDLKKYQQLNDEEITTRIINLSISNDGKKPMSIVAKKRMSRKIKERLLAAINRSHNLVDITSVQGINLPANIDLLTYSFPCQDLSLAGNWHNNQGGIDRNAKNRSSLIWEIERILLERDNLNLEMPKLLLMENVTTILSARHKKNFNEWQEVLEKLGYKNHVMTLDARNFGVPQMRERTYMLSVYCQKDRCKEKIVTDIFNAKNDKNLHKYYSRHKFYMKDVIKDDYSNFDYYKEALESNPNLTESRKQIYNDNLKLTKDTKYVPTITTKQDRHPNSGVIDFKGIKPNKAFFRYLTPRECFILMGFDEKDYQSLMDNNFYPNKRSAFFTRDKLNRMAGNSICVNVLESIFEFANDILVAIENN